MPFKIRECLYKYIYFLMIALVTKKNKINAGVSYLEL